MLKRKSFAWRKNPKMWTLRTKCIFCLIVSLMLCSEKTLGQETATATPSKQLNFNCLSREQKEHVAACFEENFECHTMLAKTTAPESIAQSWEGLGFAGLIGILSGLVIAQQLRH